MAAYLEDLKTELRTRINSVWTDVATARVWEQEQIESIPNDALTVPFAVMTIGPLSETEEFGIAAQAYLSDVTIRYVGKWGGDNSTGRAKLEALRDSLLGTVLTAGGQVLEVTGLDWSNEQYFNAQNSVYRSVMLTARVLVQP